MRPEDKRGGGQSNLFRSRLDQIVDMNHALAKLGALIDWRFLEQRFNRNDEYQNEHRATNSSAIFSGIDDRK